MLGSNYYGKVTYGGLKSKKTIIEIVLKPIVEVLLYTKNVVSNLVSRRGERSELVSSIENTLMQTQGVDTLLSTKLEENAMHLKSDPDSAILTQKSEIVVAQSKDTQVSCNKNSKEDIIVSLSNSAQNTLLQTKNNNINTK